jgi:hypothetical protein
MLAGSLSVSTERLRAVYNENFREIFILGSMLLVAVAAAAPKVKADEIYLCGDGRTLTVNDHNRIGLANSDPCISQWHDARVLTAASNSSNKVAASAPPAADPPPVAPRLTMLVNAEEARPRTVRPLTTTSHTQVATLAGSDAAVAALHRRKPPARKAGASPRKPRSVSSVDKAFRGLKNMGGGIFAQ